MVNVGGSAWLLGGRSVVQNQSAETLYLNTAAGSPEVPSHGISDAAHYTILFGLIQSEQHLDYMQSAILYFRHQPVFEVCEFILKLHNFHLIWSLNLFWATFRVPLQ